MSYGTVQAEKVTTESGYSLGAGNASSFKNRIINGAMVIDQRNAGAAVTAETYITDRWRVWRNETYSIQQSTDAPTGFSYSLRATKTSTNQSTYAYFITYIEGFNFADMLFGTANAKAVTLSFWVKSSVAGNYTAGIGNATGGVGSASTSFYPATYTINSANTWEFKTITIQGQTSGTWNGATNAAGASVYFNFGASGTATANTWQAGDVQVASAGNANLGTTNGATFAITGVQLEVGTVATSFDFRDFGRELMLCQRYFAKSYNQAIALATPGEFAGAPGRFVDATSNYASVQVFFPVRMRATPTVTIYNPSTGATASLRSDSANHPAGVSQQGEAGCWFFANDSTITTSVSCRAHYGASAEL